MKINFELSKKERLKYYNIAYGMISDKKNWKKDEKITKTFFEKKIRCYFLCFFCIPLIAFFDTFIHFYILTNILALLMIILFLYNTFSILTFFLFLYHYAKNYKAGEIVLNADGFLGNFETGKTINIEWHNLNIIIHEEIILFSSSGKKMILIPNQSENRKKIQEYLKKIQQEKHLKYGFETKGFIHHFQSWGKYALIFIILLGIAIFWDIYNISFIDDEIWKINNSGYENIDNYIYSYQKFGVIEKTLKEYFKEFYQEKENYYQNSAVTIFSNITVDLLKNNPNELDPLLKSLTEKKQNAKNAIYNIINLLEEEKVMTRIQEKRLGENYEDTFKSYALTKEDEKHISSWKAELEKNEIKMQYLKRALEILTKEKQCWYVEEDTFYMCDDYLEEYNMIYDLILEKKENQEETI